jgi:peptide/nickel transport system permease protein
MTYFSGFLLCLFITTLSKPLQFWAKRVLEFFLALPSVLLALSLAVVRGPGWTTLALSILVGSLPGFLRLLIARSEELLRTDYVRASQSVGASPLFTYCAHVFPGVLSLASVKLPNLLAGALMTEASLSFVGIGAPIGEETWGLLLAQGRDYLIEAPHIAIVTGIPLILTILALQELSEGLFQSLPNRDRISR